MKKYCNSDMASRLTGFALAAVVFFVMVPLCKSGTITGQHLGDEAEAQKNLTGYFLQSGTDILPSAGSGSSTTARIFFVNGHRFTPQLSVGVGLGFTPYSDPLSLIPFFFDFNYRFLKDGVSPTVFVLTGYNFSIKSDESIMFDDHSGGLLIHPGLGIDFPLSDQLQLYLNAGYSIDNSSYEFESWGGRIVTNDLSFRRLAFGVGFKITP